MPVAQWAHSGTRNGRGGRRQYRYHDAWRKRRDNEKYERALEFGRALPSLRQAIGRDLAAPGLGKRRVVATGVRLLDIGCFRVGSEEYAHEHETYGVATVLKEHVSVHGDELVFDYPAKGSIPRKLTVCDPETRTSCVPCADGVAGVRNCWPGRTGEPGWTSEPMISTPTSRRRQANSSAPRISGTWSATVFAAVVLGRDAEVGRSKTANRRVVTAAMREVAELLGNTPAVCRTSYIDPRTAVLLSTS